MGPGTGIDRDAFRHLFEEQREVCFRLLYRLSGNAHDAEDLLQETFARLWSKRTQFRGDGSAAGYVHRIAYRTWSNARARLPKARAAAPLESEPPDGAACPAAAAELADSRRLLLARVRAAVDALPDSQREPFLLFRYEGMTCAEVAATLDLTPKAVEMRLRAALKTLSARLARSGGNGDA